MMFTRKPTPEEYGRLIHYSKMPELNMEGCGHGHSYYGVKQNKLDPEYAEIRDLVNAVEDLLGELIGGFVAFANFTQNSTRLRYMLNYNYGTQQIPFTGVDYIELDSFKEAL